MAKGHGSEEARFRGKKIQGENLEVLSASFYWQSYCFMCPFSADTICLLSIGSQLTCQSLGSL